MHGAIDLALQAFEQGIVADDISRIDIRIYETNVLTYHQLPINNVDAQFNVPYGVACALLQGSLGLSDYEPLSINRQEILALCDRINVCAYPPFTQAYPDVYNVELLITLRNQDTRHLHSMCPSGDPEAEIYQSDPTRLAREVESKAQLLLDECGFKGAGESLIEQVHRLDEQPNISALLDAISRRQV